jgi:hypothetical protein
MERDLVRHTECAPPSDRSLHLALLLVKKAPRRARARVDCWAPQAPSSAPSAPDPAARILLRRPRAAEPQQIRRSDSDFDPLAFGAAGCGLSW